MRELETRKAIIDACLWMEATGMAIGTWGNISMRIEDNQMLVTPSKIAYDALQPTDLVVVDLEGNQLEGKRHPTSEMHLHRLLYKHRADVNAIVHCQPVYASAVCASGGGFPPILEEMSQMIGGEIPITERYINAGEHLLLAEETVKALGNKNAVLIRNHAPVCVGRDLEEAKVCCQVTEKAAKCYLALKGGMAIHTIPNSLVQAERERFLTRYGNEH